MLIDSSNLDFLAYFLCLLFSGITLLLVIGRKRIWNVFDPLNLVILNISFNSAIVFYFYYTGALRPDFAWYVLSALIMFGLGINIGSRINLLPVRYDKKSGLTSKIIGPTKQFTWLLLFLAILFKSVYIVFMLSKVGFGLLTGEVHADIKLMVFLDGGGAFKYFSWAGDIILIPVIFYSYFVLKAKKIFLIGLLFFLFYSFIFPTSKAGFVFLIFDLGLVAYYSRKYLFFSMNLKKVYLATIIVGLIPAVITLSMYGSSYQDVLKFLVVRFMDTGGATYGFFVFDGYKAFLDYSFFDRITNYFDTLLSVLRFKDWEDPNRISQLKLYLTGGYQHGYGQNPYLFVDGFFLFGYWGFLYTLILGLLIGLVRALKVGFFTFFIANKIILSAVADPDILQAMIVSLIFLSPFWFVYLIIRYVTTRKLSFPVLLLKY